MRVSLDTKRIYYINVTVMLCDTLSRITWFAFVLSVQKHSNNYIVLPKAIIFRIDLYTRSIIENTILSLLFLRLYSVPIKIQIQNKWCFSFVCQETRILYTNCWKYMVGI